MADVYSMVTEKILSEMEKGIIPWNKPWFGVRSGAINRVTKKPYSLLNQFLLMKEGEWATLKQWNDLGGKVKKGEKASFVVFWKFVQYAVKDEDGNTVLDADGKPEVNNIPMLRYYNVFHISQVDGVEPLQEDELAEENDPIEEAEKVIADYIERDGLSFESCKSNEAYYSPTVHKVVVPLFEQFQNKEEYYSTTFHELTHSTSRYLKRELNSRAGNLSGYSKEELVAEIGSATIMNYLGIETDKTFRNSVAYLESWLQVLKNDKTFIVSAAGKAEKAVNYILNR